MLLLSLRKAVPSRIRLSMVAVKQVPVLFFRGRIEFSVYSCVIISFCIVYEYKCVLALCIILSTQQIIVLRTASMEWLTAWNQSRLPRFFMGLEYRFLFYFLHFLYGLYLDTSTGYSFGTSACSGE